MSNESPLNKELVHLKQKLEILQNVYVFLMQVKADETLRNNIQKQISKEICPLIDHTTKLTLLK